MRGKRSMTPVLIEGLRECMRQGRTIRETCKILGRGSETVVAWKRFLKDTEIEGVMVDLSNQREIDELNRKFLKNIHVDRFGITNKDLVNLCQSQYDQVADKAWTFMNKTIKPTDLPGTVRI